MKNTLLTLLFAIGAIAYSFGQDCIISVKNNSTDTLHFVVITTTDTPDACPGTTGSTALLEVPDDGDFHDFIIGTVPLLDPAIRPYQLGCYSAETPGLGSSQVNECWNPICVVSDEPTFNIQFITCTSDYMTQIVID